MDPAHLRWLGEAGACGCTCSCACGRCPLKVCESLGKKEHVEGSEGSQRNSKDDVVPWAFFPSIFSERPALSSVSLKIFGLAQLIPLSAPDDHDDWTDFQSLCRPMPTGAGFRSTYLPSPIPHSHPGLVRLSLLPLSLQTSLHRSLQPSIPSSPSSSLPINSSLCQA